MTNKHQKITIDLPNGFKLVAEQNPDPNFTKEIFLGITDEAGVWYQDLAIVRPKYAYNKQGNPVWSSDEFDVLVYADKDDEDYTDSFSIGLYHGDV